VVDAPNPSQIDLHALRRQEAAAFACLVDAHQRIVLGLGQSLGLSGADLDDAAAEVFAAVYRALPSFQGRSSLGTWVYCIACRTLWKMRQRGARQPVESLDSDPLDAQSPRPDELAEEAEQQQRLWKEVAALEPRQAMVVELFYRRGWPTDQIAVVMECPVGTVKTLLFRARERLKERLARKEPRR
jgi:RNA polymerase sigma-70 factor (ECF subfamily)